MTRLDLKRIAVTRSEDQADELCSLLGAEGAVPVRCATIRIAPPARYDALDSALAQLDSYGWLVLTSPNGVRSVFRRLERLGVQLSALGGVRVAAVGPATAAALAAFGVHPAWVPHEARSGVVAESLPVAGERILVARADIADPATADILRRRGARHVDDVAAYSTVSTAPSDEALRELKRGVDGITFTSPSTVRGLTLVGPEWPELVAGTIVATVGPVTTAAARKTGLDVHAEAAEPTMGGLVEALVRAFAERTEEERR